MNPGRYFDYNATTPISKSVQQAMIEALDLFYNASSNSLPARRSKALLRDAREQVAGLLRCSPDQLCFTSGGSEANNWAIKGALTGFIAEPGHVITSAIEHPSVLEPIAYMARVFGFSVTHLAPGSDGRVRVEDFLQAIRPDTQLVSIMFANNETGVIQPVVEIANAASSRGITCHVDAVQAVGKHPVDLSCLKADLLSFSAHKFYGPKGVGGLYLRRPQEFPPLIHGGGQEMGLRAGTENLLSIAGLGRAAADCHAFAEEWASNHRRLKNQLIKRLAELPAPIHFNGTTHPDLAISNTLNFSVEGVRGEALSAMLDAKYGVQVSIGSACSNNKDKKLSHVLQAMGLNEERIQSAVRVSFGRHTSTSDVEWFSEGLASCVGSLMKIASTV